jgi:hypothetical protein
MISNCGRVNGRNTLGRDQVRPATVMARKPWASAAVVVTLASAAASDTGKAIMNPYGLGPAAGPDEVACRSEMTLTAAEVIVIGVPSLR